MNQHESVEGSERGYSLIEMMVIVVIIGVLSSFVWLRLSQLAPGYRLEGAARGLAAEIQKARARAISETKCVQVLFGGTLQDRSYTVRTFAAASPCLTATVLTSTAALQVDDSGTIGVEDANSLGSAPPNPLFSPRGANSVASSIRLSNNLGGARLLTVNSVGSVSVQ